MKLGIFGGTFDPIHNGHLFVAESARLLESLDKVLFVPTNNQHYRDKAHAGVEHRCAMILGAIATNRGFALDDTDLRDDATGYTADLLPRLHAKYPDATFTFIIGADSLVNSDVGALRRSARSARTVCASRRVPACAPTRWRA